MSAPGFGSNGLTCVSLFAGCGGSSLGYRMAGYHELLAVEWDAKACATFHANFPDVPVYEGDIAILPGAEALRLAGIAAGELDLLDGSPPCQGFSTVGKREFADGRNRLFEEFVRLLRAFRPRAFVMENVSGLRKGKMMLAFAEMTAALKAAGYRVSCRELNAWWYGVPQDRRRLIWVGVRDDLGLAPSHPQPTSRRPVTVAEALGLPSATIMDNMTGFHIRRMADSPSFTLRAASPPMVLTRERPARSWQEARPYQEVQSWQSRNLDANRPSAAQIASQVNWHPSEPRYLTVAEAKVLQGFPSWFEVDEYRLIGNSVPPPMAEAVGRHVVALLGAAP